MTAKWLAERGTGIKVFLYQEEIDEHNQQRSLQDQSKAAIGTEGKSNRSKEKGKPEPPKAKKVGNYVEPEYHARTGWNTFWTQEQREQMHAPNVFPDSRCAPMMKDVMLRTRALGKSIETYFQKFGSRIDGPTELTYDQFKLAIKNLGLSWADDPSTLRMIFTSLDQNAEHKDRGGLGLDEIALGVLDGVS